VDYGSDVEHNVAEPLEEVGGKATLKTGAGAKPPKLSVFHYLTADVAWNFAYSFKICKYTLLRACCILVVL